MAKRRSCRRTAQEEICHERAVKLRKMTDEQLCDYVDREVDKAYRKGLAESKPSGKGVGEFIAAITLAKIPGIGAVTINKLLKVAKDNGYME